MDARYSFLHDCGREVGMYILFLQACTIPISLIPVTVELLLFKNGLDSGKQSVTQFILP